MSIGSCERVPAHVCIRSLIYIIAGAGAVTCFVLLIVALVNDVFYYQESSKLNSHIIIEADYGYEQVTYKSKFVINGETYNNYTNSYYYDDSYDLWCKDMTYQQSWCPDLKRMNDKTNLLTDLWAIAALGAWLLLFFELLFRCMCQSTKFFCCFCCQCENQCRKSYKCNFCLSTLSMTSVTVSLIAYSLFLYLFIDNFNKSKNGLSDFVVYVSPYQTIEWNSDMKEGNSFSQSFWGLACIIVSFVCLFGLMIAAIKRETCLFADIDYSPYMNKNKNNNNNNDNNDGTTILVANDGNNNNNVGYSGDAEATGTGASQQRNQVHQF